MKNLTLALSLACNAITVVAVSLLTGAVLGAVATDSDPKVGESAKKLFD